MTNTEVHSGRIQHEWSRLFPVSAFAAGLALMFPGLSAAAEPSAAVPAAADARSAEDIQAEIEKLRQALERDQQALSAKAAAGAAAGDPATAAGGEGDANQPKQLNKVRVRAAVNRQAAVKDVPKAIAIVTGQELAAESSLDIGDITKRLAGITWNQGNQRTSSLSIRGIGKIGQTEAQDPSVGVSVDGVPYVFNPLTSSVDFTDINTVSVTRGPQGTLLGKNNSLGVISIETVRPSFTPEVDYSLTVADNGHFLGDGVIGTVGGGGPIVNDLLAWRGSLSVDKGKGQMTNAYDKDNTTQNHDRVTGRLQFLLKPSDAFSARLSANFTPIGGENTNGYTINTPTPLVYADGKPNTALNNEQRLSRAWFTSQAGYSVAGNYLYGGGSDFSNNYDGGFPVVTGSNGASVTLDWHRGDYALTSITAYQSYHFNARNDEGTPFAISSTGGVNDNLYKQYTQELRLHWDAGGFFSYQTGFFLSKTNTNYSSISNWLQDAGAWYASNAQYNTLYYGIKDGSAPGAGYSGSGDSDAGAGRYLLEQSVNGLWKTTHNDIRNKTAAWFAQTDWRVTQPLTVTTGLRLTYESRKNPTWSLVTNEGTAPELDPDPINGVVLGGGPSAAANNDKIALKYFKLPYASLNATQLAQISAARALSKGQIGTLWNTIEPDRFQKVLPTAFISPSYKIDADQTAYVSWQYGAKAGIAQVVNAASHDAAAEKTNAYELGYKALLLSRTLTVNADLYLMDIRNFQQAVQVYDPYATAALYPGGPGSAGYVPQYVSATGNAAWVRSQGLEFEIAYTGITYTTIRFNGAYTDAFYKDFKNSGQPVENADLAVKYRDVSGQTIAGAAKWTGDFGVDYRVPLYHAPDYQFHTTADVLFTTKYNSDVALSSYAQIDSHATADFAIGLGRSDRRFDFSLVVKNILGDTTHTLQTWNSYQPALARWFGLRFAGQL